MRTKEQNIHLSYDMSTKAYHIVMARLVKKYTPSGGHVLDVGCGMGHTLSLVKAHDSSFVLSAADIDLHCVQQTDAKVNLLKGIQINDVDDLFVPNEEGLYDAIIMSHVLEHVKRPYDTVRGLMKLLKPGGHLFLAVPNPVTPKVILANILQNYQVNEGHIQTWDHSHWRNFLEKILEVNVLEYPIDFLNLPVLEKIGRARPMLMFLAKIFPAFSRSCMAVIKKDI